MFGNIMKVLGGAVLVAIAIFWISQQRGPQPTNAQGAPLTAITVDGNTTVAPGQQLVLQANPVPTSAQLKSVTWYLGSSSMTSNPLVVTAPMTTGTYPVSVVASDSVITKTVNFTVTVGIVAPTATAAPTSAPAPTATNTPNPTATSIPPAPAPTSAPVPTATATTMPAIDPTTLKTGSKNLPAKAESVEVTGKDHKNTIGLGTQAFLAEPGVYTCEASKCPQKDLDNGAANPINPDTQYNLSANQQWANVPEGGWGMVSGNFFTMTTPDGKQVTLSAGPMNSAFLYIRGKYRGDGDRNSQVQFSNFMAGHALWTRLPMGAFVSEGYAVQNIDAAFNNSVNCGDDGCKRVLVGYVDLNTGAFGTWWVDRATDGSLTWTKDTTNY